MGKWQERDEKDIHEIMITEGVSYERAKTRLRAAEFLAVLFLGGGLLIATVGWLISSLWSFRTYVCDHENLDMSSARIDVVDAYAYIDCNDCGKEKRLDVETTVKTSSEPTCQRTGTQTVTWYIKDFPEITRITYTELPRVDCVISDIHVWGKEATCTAEGRTDSGHCMWCSGYVQAKAIPKTPHDFILREGTAPTCQKPGLAAYSCCTVCGFVEAEGTEIPKIDHEFISGVHEAAYNIGSFKGELCIHCQNPGKIEEIYSEPLINEYFEYTVNETDNYVTITKVLKTADEMVIPDTVNGVPVKYLAESLFFNGKIKKITLSENLLEIPARAFENCSLLETVNIPDSVERIGDTAFKNCFCLTKLYIENASIGYSAFENCKGLRTVEMGLNAYTVDAYAFRDCIQLIYVKFSEKADRYTVSATAFDNTYCYYASVAPKADLDKTISDEICHYVEYGNYNDLIEEVNGFYYDKKSDVLIAIDNETATVVIPDRVGALAEGFYLKCKTAIFSIVIPSTVKDIPIVGIQYTSLPFYGQVNFKNAGKVQVYYEGSEDDWKKIEGGILLKLYDLHYLGEGGTIEYLTDEWFVVHHTGEWEYSENGDAKLK